MTSNSTGSGVLSLDEPQLQLKSESLFTKALHRLLHDRLTMTASGVILFFILLSVSAPVISDLLNVNPNTTDGRNNFLPVCNPFADQVTTNANGQQVVNLSWLSCQRGNYLGTDNLGRDHLSRLLHAGQISLAIGFGAAIMTLLIGLALGMATGYFGGIFDDFVTWVITTLNSVPILYLLIAISAIFSPSPEALVFVFAITDWTGATRLVRGQTFSIRDLDYVLAARALGANPTRIMRLHVFPNLISVLAVALALALALGIGNKYDFGRSRVELPQPGRATTDANLGQHAHRKSDLFP